MDKNLIVKNDLADKEGVSSSAYLENFLNEIGEYKYYRLFQYAHEFSPENYSLYRRSLGAILLGCEIIERDSKGRLELAVELGFDYSTIGKVLRGTSSIPERVLLSLLFKWVIDKSKKTTSIKIPEILRLGLSEMVEAEREGVLRAFENMVYILSVNPKTGVSVT